MGVTCGQRTRWVALVLLGIWVMVVPAATVSAQAPSPLANDAIPTESHHKGVAEELLSGQVADFIEKFTYVAIVAVLLLCGMGLPLPEEVPILTSAILAASGHLRPWWALGALMVGVIVGDSAMFLLGRHWGSHVLEHRFAARMLTPERRQKIAVYFHQYGAWIIFVARFLPGLRAPLFLTSGTMRVPFWLFLTMDGAAAILSIPTSFWLAYYFTDKLDQFLKVSHAVQYWAFGILAVLVALGFFVKRWYLTRRRSRQVPGAALPPQEFPPQV